MAGFFGDMFDLNHDGELDAFERAMKFDFLETMEQEDSDSEEDDDDEDYELELAGLDPDEFDF